jgi:serine protease Do
MARWSSNRVTAVFSLAVLAGCTQRGASPEPGVGKVVEPVPLPAAVPGQPAPASLSEVAERVLPAVVSVASTRVASADDFDLPFDDPLFRHFLEPFGPFQMQRGRRPEIHGLGSGVLVGKGLLLTNAHVVEGASSLEIIAFDRRELKGEVVGLDRKSDLAVLRIRGKTDDLKSLEFGVGETVTMGIVSAIGRANVGVAAYEDFIQTDAAINPGNSGGALVDTQGRLVGIPTAILSRSGGYMGIGFAIPSNMAKPIMDALLTHGRVVRGWLGVAIQDVDEELANALGLRATSGVLVADVSAGSPAERAGLKRGDLVVELDGAPVRSSSELRNLIADAGASKAVKLGIVRGDKHLELEATLGEAPNEPSRPSEASPAESPGGIDGLTVAPLDQATRKDLQIPARVQGVVVTAVEPGSDAARAGLRRGDVVSEVNRKPLKSPGDLVAALAKIKGPVALLVFRQGQSAYVVVRR